MSLLADADRQKVADELAHLANPVRLLFFTQTIGCEMCLPTRQIVDEVAALSDRVTVEEYNFVLDKEKVAEYGIDKVPAVAVVGAEDTGIRFYGIPAGYEFMSLIEAVQLAASGESGLSPESRALLAGVTEPVTIQVFVTPT